jgi:alpha-galactosidase
VSYVHSLNLGFGLYGDRGTMDCGKAPGQYQHEAHDSAWLASHKIDWFKCVIRSSAAPVVAATG